MDTYYDSELDELSKRILEIKSKRQPKDDKVKAKGTREEVWRGEALKTGGGLTKDDLFEKDGKIVSKKRSECAKVNISKMREGRTKKVQE